MDGAAEAVADAGGNAVLIAVDADVRRQQDEEHDCENRERQVEEATQRVRAEGRSGVMFNGIAEVDGTLVGGFGFLHECWSARWVGPHGRNLLLNEMEGALPACLIEDVDEDVAHEAEALADALLVDLVGGSLERPVDEEGAAYDVLARDEAPVAAVEAFGTVVAHGEDFAGGDDEVAVLNVAGKLIAPAGGDVAVVVGGDGGKVVAVGIEGVLRVVVVGGHAGVGLVLCDAVEIDDAVAEVDAVAGNADGALDEEEIRLAGLEEDDDVAALDVAIEGERRPFGGWGEGDAVDQDVVTDEESLHHRGRGDLEVLEDEGHDEETDGEDGADGGEGLKRSFGLLLLGDVGGGGFGCDGFGQDSSPQIHLSVYR